MKRATNRCPKCNTAPAQGHLVTIDMFDWITADGRLKDDGPVLCVEGRRRCKACKHEWVPPFLAFGGQDYYPSGGMDDLIGAFDTEAEAKAAICELIDIPTRPQAFCANDWGQIVDSRTLVIVETVRPWEVTEEERKRKRAKP